MHYEYIGGIKTAGWLHGEQNSSPEWNSFP